MNVTLTPAYGRDYKSKKAVLAGWNAGQDFSIATFALSVSSPSYGRYMSERDNEPFTSIWIRYNNLERIIQVK